MTAVATEQRLVVSRVEDGGRSSRERELASILASYNEVTERLRTAHERLGHEVQRLREQLDEKNRELARKERLAALGEMAAGLAHEIRNPLGAIQLFASLLERDLHDRAAPRELAVKISNGVRALDAIVTDIVAFAGPHEVTLRPVELAPLIVETLELTAPQRRIKDAQVAADVESCRVTVQANGPQLQRALLNLLLNAIDAVSEGGHVWIACRASVDSEVGRYVGDVESVREGETKPAWVWLEVADDGPGVPPGSEDRIFHPFYTTKDAGTGLGLAIVHRIAETHGRGVRLRPRPGGGAVFAIGLRVVE